MIGLVLIDRVQFSEDAATRPVARPGYSSLMTRGYHDTLVYRRAQMLVKLNHGEKLDPQALVDEFGVTLRTI